MNGSTQAGDPGVQGRAPKTERNVMDDMVHVHETIPTVETKATEPFQPESLRDTVNEELDCLFGIFQGAADDLEQALDRIEEEEVWEIAEAAGDAKIAVYSATCNSSAG